MDTIGDAYVVAGFISAADTPGRGSFNARCRRASAASMEAVPVNRPSSARPASSGRPSSASAVMCRRPSTAAAAVAVGARRLSHGMTGAAAAAAAAEVAAAAVGPGAAAIRGVCEDVLFVAGAMISAIRTYREESGRDAHCR